RLVWAGVIERQSTEPDAGQGASAAAAGGDRPSGPGPGGAGAGGVVRRVPETEARPPGEKLASQPPSPPVGSAGGDISFSGAAAVGSLDDRWVDRRCAGPWPYFQGRAIRSKFIVDAPLYTLR